MPDELNAPKAIPDAIEDEFSLADIDSAFETHLNMILAKFERVEIDYQSFKVGRELPNANT